MPLAIDCIVATENSKSIVFLIRPRVRAMCQRLCEKEEGPSRTLIRIPNQRVLASDCVGCCVDGFMTRRNKQRATLPIFDRIQLPDDAS